MTIKLDKINQRILYELDKNCRISDNQLAKLVNRSRESVRNRINKLAKQKIIQAFILSIDPAKIGRIGFKVYFQLKNNPEKRNEFKELIQKQKGLYWFAESDGVWDFHTTFYNESITEFNEIKNKIFSKFKELIVKKDSGVLVNVRQYTKRFLLTEAKNNEEAKIYGEQKKNALDLDELDKNIIDRMSFDARIPLTKLALEINSTIDIVRHRIKKLEEKEIIFQYRVAIDHNKLGYSMYKAFVYFDNISSQTETKLFEYAKQETRIFNIVRQLSSWDIELEIMAKTYEEFTDIMNNIRNEFKDVIRNYELILIKDEVWVFEHKNNFL